MMRNRRWPRLASARDIGQVHSAPRGRLSLLTELMRLETLAARIEVEEEMWAAKQSQSNHRLQIIRRRSDQLLKGLTRNPQSTAQKSQNPDSLPDTGSPAVPRRRRYG